jgi:hypothetical protein
MYIEYQPLSKKPDASTFVPPELAEAQKQAIARIPAKISKNWDEWVGKKLDFTVEELWEFLSSEQIDSIGLCIYNFENGRNFIIGDETGIGKGRILSGISRWAWKTGKKVLFFTEREHLMSEFWKDLHDTHNIGLLKNPIAFHSKSKIFNPDGTVALKGTTKLVKTIEESGFDEDTNLVMTNYSQISLKQHKKNKKGSLEDYCDNTIIILDEAHNATGDSNTKKMLMALSEKAKHIVFSSATYIKDESQLDLYQSSINFDEDTLELLKKTLKNDHKGTLRKIFTYELTRNLQFWRREHQPLDVGWQTVFADNDEYNNKVVQEYSELINGLFQIVSNLNKDPALENQMAASSWFALGATINRLSRNLLLVLKLDALVGGVEKSIKEDHKAVIVIDSTLSSLVKKIKTKDGDSLIDDETEGNQDGEEKDFALNFQQAILYVIEEVLGDVIHNQGMDGDLFMQYEGLKEKSKIFADLSISPIDTIIQKLAEKNIKCGEISGRTFCLNKNGHIDKLIKDPKTSIVRAFNSGELDALIITRAGASGISLHASAAFKDQRIRDLYELEITNRPTYRLQFIGRVNRKNQVAQPRFFTVITKLPFEQRILNVEQRKLKTLQSHISGDDEKMGQENVYNFYNLHTDKCAYVFLQNHPHLAYQMGINMKSAKEDFYYIDSILKRCIVLSNEQQNALYDYLIYTVESYVKLQLRKNVPLSVELQNMKTFWHSLDEVGQKEFKEIYGNFPELSINQFRFPWVGLMKTNSTYHTKSLFSRNLQVKLEKNMEKDPQIKSHLEKVCNTIVARQKYNSDFINGTAIPLLRSLKLGLCITIKGNDGKIFGYVHDIEIPRVREAWKYESLTLIHIKTINPHIHSSIHYANEDYYVNLEELIESDMIELNNNPINWNQFDRPEKTLVRSNFCFVGHPVYMQFLQQSYKVGEIEYFNFRGKNQMCVVLPSNMTEEQIVQLKKPIYQANRIMAGLIAKQIGSLTSSWEPEDQVKAIFKLEPTTGGYNLLVASEVNRNYDIIDFPLKKKLQDFRGNMNGYVLYFLPYKDVRGVLWMLEQRNVIWFINKKVKR